MSTTTPSVTDLLNAMQGLTVTGGWDVVNGMAAGTLNQLLQEQYVEKAYAQQSLPPINGQVVISSNLFGTVSAQFVDVVLSAPLVQIDAGLDAQSVKLWMNFVAGVVNLVTEVAGVSVVTSSQMITPTNQYSLQGTVPLTSVQGVVSEQQVITLDIVNGSSFVANLGLGNGSETLLGDYFLTYLQTEAGSLSYSLGTISTQSNGTELVPTFFDFATQIDPNNPSDAGRLLIFVATQYNPAGGSGRSLSLVNIVPMGYSATLLVSSAVLFAGILQSFLQTQLRGLDLQFSATQLGSGKTYQLTLNGGSLNVGSFYERGGSGTLYYSANLDQSAYCPPQADVVVPLNDLRLFSQNNGIALNWNGYWTQSWARQEITLFGTPPCGQDSDGASSYVSSLNVGSVDSATDVISFKSPAGTTVVVNFGQQLWGFFGSDTIVINDFLSQIQQEINYALSCLFNFNLPDINAFVVSNLLFSQNNLLGLQTADVPGDLVCFGELQTSDLTISPLQPSLRPSESVTFTVRQNGQSVSNLQWSLSPAGVGSLSNSGVYMAPATIGQVQQLLVTASNPNDGADSVSAMVLLLPTGMMVSPYIALMTAGQAPQPFVAASDQADGQWVNWSVSPDVGMIDDAGIYTPPSSVTVARPVTITATSQQNFLETGTATVVLLPDTPTGLAVLPNYVSLKAGEQQVFSAGAEAVYWEIMPMVGSITNSGVYTAPGNIQQPQGVVVIVTSQTNSAILGTAVIGLTPS